MQIKRIVSLVALLGVLGGCTNSYTLIEPGPAEYGGLKVQTSQAWNLAPKVVTPMAHKQSALWTQDGPLLDRLLIIPAVPDGKPLFKQKSKSLALPVFRADMTVKDIEELTESSITKLFGEGQVLVETANLRPHRFGSDRGALFDIEMAVNDGPNYRGVAGAFTSSDQLFLLIYLGADPYYFEKHRDEALNVIRGATL